MAPTISISPASREDIVKLAEINDRAYADELMSRFAWKSASEDSRRKFFEGRIGARFGDPRATHYKAVDVDIGTILGFVCLTHENKAEDEARGAELQLNKTTASHIIMHQMPPGMNLEFAMKTGAEVEALKSKAMDGDTNKYYISSFAVMPGHQGQGIGSQLLKHCLDIADQAGLRTWLMAFPGSHSLYLRSGFKDVDFHEIDLNVWDNNRFRGYGLYRTFAMVRDPASHS